MAHVVSATLVLAALLGRGVDASVVHAGLGWQSRSQGFLAVDMQPGIAARSLAKVEEEWQAQAALFAECAAAAKAGAPEDPLIDCAAAPKAFAKSCATTVKAIYQGSSGDRSVATEYMSDVCDQQALVGWHRDRCHGLADAIVSAMSEDSYYNREVLDGSKLCHNLWEHLAEDERRRVAAEEAADERAAAQHAKQQVAASPAAAHSLAASSVAPPDLPAAAAGKPAEARTGAGGHGTAAEKANDRAKEVAASPAAVHAVATAGEEAQVAAGPAVAHALAATGKDDQALPPMGAHPPPGVPRGPPAHAAAPAPAGPPGRRHRGGHGKRQE